MNTRMIKPTGLFLMAIVVLAISACGTLQIDTEPAARATEVVQPAPTGEETGPVTPTEAAPPAAEPSPTATPAVEEEDTVEPIKTTAPVISTVDETWLNYRNDRLGFSINFPVTMVHFFGSCKWNEENGDHSYRPAPSYVPVKIFEDGDTVYITSEYYHALSGMTKETNADGGTVTFFSDCQVVENSLDLLRDPENHSQAMWEIVAAEVHNDEDLDAFIKTRYGSGCSLGEETAATQDGVYDVTVQGDGKDLSETTCPLNYGTVIKYYPEVNRVITWNTGQAYTFPADTAYSVTYDQEMIDSFRFLAQDAG